VPVCLRVTLWANKFHSVGRPGKMMDRELLARRYVAVRCGLWMLLLTVAVIDWLRNKMTRSKGWELHRVVLFVIFLFTLQESLSFVYLSGHEDNRFLEYVLMICFVLADSGFLLLLLLISTGWCITQFNLRHRCFVLTFPAIHFVTTLIVELSLGRGEVRYEDSIRLAQWQRIALVLSSFISLMTLFYTWYWIFECLQEERKGLIEKLSPPAPPVLTAAPVITTQESTIVGRQDDAQAQAMRQVLSEEDEVIFSADQAKEDNFVEEDDDDNIMPARAKLRLLTHFQYVVQVYLFAVIAVLLYTAWENSDSAAVRLPIEIFNFVAMAALAFTFRLRPQNPYYLLDDYEFTGEQCGEAVPMQAVRSASPFAAAAIMTPVDTPADTPVRYRPDFDEPGMCSNTDDSPPPGPKSPPRTAFSIDDEA
jgi:hypothetical protein